MFRGLIAILTVAFIAVCIVGSDATLSPASAQQSPQSKAKKKGLKGTIGYRKAYSYSKSDVVGSDTRRFYDPSYTRQTPGGPFDNGFFFDSAYGRNAGEAPYMH
jgi:hypothetical protein